jgi:hypothetical protein
MSHEALKPILTDYVNKNSNVQCLQWDQNMSMKLLFDPYAKSYSERKKIAHYFLLVASITETRLIGRAENSRGLMIQIHSFLGNDCFRPGQVENFEKIVRKSAFTSQLGPPSKYQIPQVLESVNRFVQEVAEGDLIEYARRFAKPEDIVKEIGNNITRMGGRYIEKTWMYMRWMTRPYPDLRIFSNFSPRDLYVPMTSCIRDVAFCLGLCSEPKEEWWDDFNKVAKERKRFTEFAKELFPEDPVKVDYPFYVLGRWIGGKHLRNLQLPARLQLLKEYLQFWEKIYDAIQRPPVTFDIISREESTFEHNIESELKKLQFMFSFEPHIFNLAEDQGPPRYTPDFVLPNCKKDGKIVILEPHGPWTRPEKRIVRIGHRRFPIWVRPTQVNPDELRFVSKLKKFREIYGKMYYLILIVPSRFKDRVEEDYPEAFDEIWDGSDTPKLLFNLKKYCN